MATRVETTERREARQAREALALVVGIARAHREHAASGIPPSEGMLLDAMTRIEEYGCRAMPWLRDVE